jgi:hypothetical protein
LNKWFRLPDVRYAALDADKQEKFKKRYEKIFQCINPNECKGFYFVLKNTSHTDSVNESDIYLVLEDFSAEQEASFMTYMSEVMQMHNLTVTEFKDKNGIRDIADSIKNCDYFEFGSDYASRFDGSVHLSDWKSFDFLQKIRQMENVTATVHFEPIDRKFARQYQMKMLQRAMCQKNNTDCQYYRSLYNSGMFRVTIRIYADRTEEKNIQNCFKGFRYDYVEYNGRPTAVSELLKIRAKKAVREGVNNFIGKHYFASDICRELHPFFSLDLIDKEGFYYGENPVTHRPILFDRKFGALSSLCGFIFGTAGSGKTYFAEAEAKQVLEKTNDDIIIADPEGCFGRTIPENMITDVPITTVNPMDIVFSDYYGDEDREDEIGDKEEYVLSLIGCLLELEKGTKDAKLNAAEENLILHAFRKTFDPFFAMMDKRKSSGEGEWRYDFEQNPTLADFIKELTGLLDSDSMIDKKDKELVKDVSELLDKHEEASKSLKEQIGNALVPEYCKKYENLKHIIEKYGKYLSAFNCHTNVPADSRVIRLSFRNGYARFTPLYFLTAVSFVHNRSLLRLISGRTHTEKTERWKAVWVYWDEAHIALSNENTAYGIFKLTKKSRTELTNHTFLSQSLSDVLKTDSGQCLVSRAGVQWFLKPSYIDEEDIQKLYWFSEKEFKYMKESFAGSGMFCTGSGKIPFCTNQKDKFVL